MMSYEDGTSGCSMMSKTPGTIDLVVMSYDRLIDDLKNAMKLHSSSMNDQAFLKNQHAQDIITELLLGLDYSNGGQIAGNLSRIYNFALTELVSFSPNQDTKIYKDLINIFGSLKEAWMQINIRN
jgi:flagellar protein FliS